MYCRLCGKSGSGSENPLNTLPCGHSFHADCLKSDECPICANNDKKCAICLEPMLQNENVTVLDGCMHTFHSSCIIPYFRRPDTHGQCPLCRRNPFLYEDDEDMEEDDDSLADTWQAMHHIRELEKARITPQQRKKIDSGLKKARDALKKARELKKKAKKSRQYSRTKQELQDAQKALKEAAAKIRSSKSAIKKVDRLGSRQRTALRWQRRLGAKKKILLGSRANPEWQYLQADGSWSEMTDRGTLIALADDNIITNETLIRHTKLPEGVEWNKIKGHIRMYGL